MACRTMVPMNESSVLDTLPPEPLAAQQSTGTAATGTTPTVPPRVSRPIGKPKRRKKLIFGGVAIVVTGLVLSQIFRSGETAAAAPTAQAAAADIPLTATAHGTVAAAQTVPLSFRATGVITNVDAIVGQSVKAGARLAQIDPTPAERDIAVRAASVAEAEARLAAVKLGAAASPKERAAGRASLDQTKSQVDASRRAETEAARVRSQGRELNAQTIKQAQAQLTTDRQQLKVEEARLEEQLTKRTTALAKRDAEQAALDKTKERTLSTQTVRNAARDDLTRHRQKVAELQAVRDEAARVLQRLTADDERARTAAQGNADPSAPFFWAKSTAVTNAEATVATTERNLATAEAASIPLQASLEQAQELVAKAESDQAQAQGRTDTAIAGVEAAQAGVEAANRTREQAAITVGRSQDALAVAKRNADLNDARDRQAVETAKQSTKQAESAVKATDAANAAKEQPGRPADIAAARATVEGAKASLQQAQDRLSEYTIVSPFDGVVTAVAIKQGEVGSPTTSAITVITASGFLVRVGFPEIDAARIEAGDPATVTFDALPETPIKGKVESVEPSATTVNGVSTYFARVLLESIPPTVRVGMSASVKVLFDTRTKVVTVPLVAVGQTEDGTASVKRVVTPGDDKTPNKIEVITVETGATANGSVEIVSGIKIGDVVELPLEDTK
jgi:HlyD family secretion protein